MFEDSNLERHTDSSTSREILASLLSWPAKLLFGWLVFSVLSAVLLGLMFLQETGLWAFLLLLVVLLLVTIALIHEAYERLTKRRASGSNPPRPDLE
jgi:hypothetical protein